MVLPTIFTAALFASLVASTPLSRDNDVLTVNNCSGTSTVHPPTYLEASDSYGPQLGGNAGFEEWSFSVNFEAEGSFMVGKWIRGEPTDPDSILSQPAILLFFNSFANGTVFNFEIKDTFVYTDDNNVKKMSIADNYMLWDGNLGVWNLSVNVEGFSLETSTVVSDPGYPFTPNYQGKPGLLIDDLYSSIHVPRGHMSGTVKFAWGLEWAVSDYTSFRHTYSAKALQETMSSYTRGTTWLVDQSPASTVNWFQAISPGGKEVNAVYFAKQTDQSANESPIQLQYQLTDESSLLDLAVSGLTTSIVLPGCEAQGNQPFVWDIQPIKRRGTYNYPSGALLEYYEVSVSAALWDNGKYTDVEGGLGFIEVFTSL